MTWLLVGSFAGFLAMGVPIAFVIGLSSVLFFLVQGRVPLAIVVQRLFSATDSFQLMAIPLFILAGALMNAGGLSQRLVELSRVLVGWLRGGLAQISVVTSIFFSGISGAAAADASAVGSIMLPAMERAGYRKAFGAAVVAGSSLIGPIIPPSIPMILYGVSAGASISALFLAGAIPGLLLGLAQMGVAYAVAVRDGYPRERRATLVELAAGVRGGLLAALMPAIILGGILGGVFTPTEAAAVAVLYALVVGGLVYRELSVRDLPRILWETAITTGVVMLMIGTTDSLGWIMAAERIPQQLAGWLLSISAEPWVVLLLINAALLLIGIPLEPAPALLILVPVLLPLARELGVDPIHLGVVMVLNLVIGLVTPPVGASLFVVSSIGRVPLGDLSRALVPFILASIAILLLVTYVPALSLWLPALAR
ncbi:TRAP transporter large permease [Limnochorda pilosa]|uniref:C4-dicarboxylate ABC transporter permease n=1 Tax=Limnochorda pilosa TaxID=1555112 RepID=A0A0K2SHW0_LIMPI|nr:TRAP transporter large permease [Limnochorda pilosa]BAS26660.1 C4-dicarboxylate ABC transporter permease [Limnochorda pilosa]